MLRLALPAVAEGLFQVLFNLTDVFWVGRGLGPAALAGVSTAGFAVWMLLAAAETAAVGLTAVESRRLGEGRRDAAAAAVFQAFSLSVLLALLLGALGLTGLSRLFALMGTPPEVTAEGTGYLTVYLSGAPVVFTYFVMAAAFRAAGDTRTPLLILVGSVLANVVLDPLLIFGVGPFPALGIQGAAAATLLTRGGGCVAGYALLRRRRLIVGDRPRLAEMLAIGRIGFPVAVGGFVFSAVYMVLTRVTSQFGTEALAALGVGHRIESISFMACVGFGVAAATAVGQNLGADRPDRARRAGRAAASLALAVTAAVAAVFLLAPERVVGLFSADPGVVEAGSAYLRIIAPAQLFMALHLTLEIGMEGAGYTTVPMAASVLLTLLRVPLAIFLAGPLGLAGVWWAISGTAIARGGAVLAIWMRGRWQAKVV